MNIFKEIKNTILYEYHNELAKYALTKMLVYFYIKDKSEFNKWHKRFIKHADKCSKILLDRLKNRRS